MDKCVISEHLKVGKEITDLLGDRECRLIMEYLITLESFRLMHSKIKRYSGINKLPLKSCIEEVSVHLNRNSLATDIKPLLDYRNSLVHDINVTLATMHHSNTLSDNIDKLRDIVVCCWSELETKEDERVTKRMMLTSNFVL